MKRHTTTLSAIRTLPDEQLATITGGHNRNGWGDGTPTTLSASPTGIGRASLAGSKWGVGRGTIAYTDDGKTLA